MQILFWIQELQRDVEKMMFAGGSNQQTTFCWFDPPTNGGLSCWITEFGDFLLLATFI